jgi:hypothetical protein
MDTLKTPLAPAAPLPSIPWRPALHRLAGLFATLGLTGEARFLAEAQDLADLEHRLRSLERDGLHDPRWPVR